MDDTLLLIDLGTNYYTVVVVLLISIVLGRRVFKEKRELGKLNIARSLTFLLFLTCAYLFTLRLIYENTPLGNYLSYEEFMSFRSFSFFSFGAGLLVTVGSTLVVYGIRLRPLFLTPSFIYVAMVIYYLFTGYDELLFPYMVGAACFTVILLFYIGLRLRDNGPLGIGIFFILAFLSFAFDAKIIGITLKLIYPSFGLFFALGYFKVFNEKEKGEGD